MKLERFRRNPHQVDVGRSRPLVAVVADERKSPGGANEVIENIRRALKRDFIVREEYVKMNLGVPILLLPWLYILHIRWAQSRAFRRYHAIITVHPFAHYLKHQRHFYYVIQLNRLFHDLHWPLWKQSGFIVRLALAFNAPIVRILDRALFLSMLDRANAAVLSKNVRRQIRKNLDVVYPGGYIDAAEL